MSVLLEIAVDTIDGFRIAVAAGADRIELCSALSVGGLTPSLGFMREVAGLPVPSFAMIRPRGGNFAYSSGEARIMRRDIQAALDCGISGFVFGALRGDGSLDTDLLADLLALSGGLPVTLHRAFDLVPDQFAALEQASILGFTRVLSSGQEVDAAKGASRLAALIGLAGDRLTILPGGGIRAENVAAILAGTGAHELHAACQIRTSADAELVRFGFVPSDGRADTDATTITNLRRAIDQTESRDERVSA